MSDARTPMSDVKNETVSAERLREPIAFFAPRPPSLPWRVAMDAEVALTELLALRQPTDTSEGSGEVAKYLDEILELNKTAEDENGHRWQNSDLIHQSVMLAKSALSSALTRIQRAEKERDDVEEEVGRIIMALPPGTRGGGALAGVKALRSRVEAAEAQLEEARKVMNQCRLAFGGTVSVQSAIDMLDKAPAPASLGENTDAE